VSARHIVRGANRSERTASVAALTTAAGAVVCGVCCVVPFAFPAVAAAGSGSLLAWIAGAHTWATAFAAVIVASAWIFIAVQSRWTLRGASRATLCWMAAATAALIVAILWPRVEPQVIRLLTQR
jgi:hypothetical protein